MYSHIIMVYCGVKYTTTRGLVYNHIVAANTPPHKRQIYTTTRGLMYHHIIMVVCIVVANTPPHWSSLTVVCTVLCVCVPRVLDMLSQVRLQLQNLWCGELIQFFFAPVLCLTPAPAPQAPKSELIKNL